MARRKKINMNREYFRERCTEVDLFNAEDRKRIDKIIEDLRDTLRGNKELVALSAPQIASRDRIFCMKFAGNDIRTFINPLIISRKESHLNEEKQIGFGDYNNEIYFVPRFRELVVGYQTPTGKVESTVLTNEASCVFEQMIQLLDGVFISDFGLLKLEGFDDLSKEEKTEIFKMYAEYLKGQQEELNKEFEEDEALKNLNDLTRFYTDVALGKVELLTPTEEDEAKVIKKEETE